MGLRNELLSITSEEVETAFKAYFAKTYEAPEHVSGPEGAALVERYAPIIGTIMQAIDTLSTGDVPADDPLLAEEKQMLFRGVMIGIEVLAEVAEIRFLQEQM